MGTFPFAHTPRFVCSWGGSEPSPRAVALYRLYTPYLAPTAVGKTISTNLPRYHGELPRGRAPEALGLLRLESGERTVVDYILEENSRAFTSKFL